MNSTICPFCSCGCRTYPRISPDERLTGLIPLKNHPVSRGSLCVRGWNSYEYVTHPDRLKVPRVAKNGQQVDSTWEEAIAHAADALTGIAGQWGPDSVGFIGSSRCSNEDNYLLMKLARGVLKTGNIDTADRLAQFPILDALNEGLESAAFTVDLEDLADADFVLAVGTDLFTDCPKVASRVIEALNRGAKLAVVDPRTTKLTKLAHYHLPSYPGTGPLWINGMITHLIRKEKVDAAFINHKTSGYHLLKKELADFSLSRAEAEFGISSDLVKAVSELFFAADNAVIVVGGNTTNFPDDTTIPALINLALITGHAGKNKSGIIMAGGNNNSMGAWDMGVAPRHLPGGVAVSTAGNDVISRLGLEGAPRAGYAYNEMLSRISTGDIRALYVMGDRLLSFTAEREELLRSGANGVFLVVQDIFPSKLTDIADVVLPAMTHFERGGTFTNLERRVQRFDPVHVPRGDTRADWDILNAVARAMGVEFGFDDVFQITDEIASVVPAYHYMTSANLGDDVAGVMCRADGSAAEPYLQETWKVELRPSGFPGEFKIDTDGQFPLIMCSGGFPCFWGTGSRSTRIHNLAREQNAYELQLNPNDAQRYSVKRGWPVRIVAPTEKADAILAINDELREGVAHLRVHKIADESARIPRSPVRIRVESR